MKNKSTLGDVFYHIWAILLAISIVLALLSLSISINSKDFNYFHNFQIKNRIDKQTDKKQDELDKISKDTILYLQTGEDSLLKRHFNDREIAHMSDVFKLYELNRSVTSISVTFIIITLVMSLIFKNKNRLNKKTFFYILGIIILSIVIVFIVSKDFNKYFIKFHEVFFDNDLWLLNPETDLMIQMMPLDFFIGMAKNIFIYFVLSLIVIMMILIIDVYINKKSKRCLLCNLTVVG